MGKTSYPPWTGLARLLVGTRVGRFFLRRVPSDGGIELLASIRPSAALELVSELAARRPDEPLWCARRGDLLLAAGRYAEAFEMYRQYLPDHPADRKRLRALVACGVQGGLQPQVRELLETMARQHPDEPDPRNYLGVLHLVRGELDQAESIWQALLAEDPRYGPARANMGIIYHFRGRFAQAILEFKLAMELDPEFGHIARGNLGNAYYLLGRYEEAREVLEGLVRQHPDYAEARLILARTLAALGSVDEAISLLETVRKRMRPEYALAVDTSLAEDLALLARLYLQRGDLEEAEKACRQSLGEGQDTLEALTLLGQICLARGKPQEAVAPLEKAASLSTGEPRGDLIHRHLALAYYQVGRVSDATEAFRKAGSSPMDSLGEDDPDPAAVASRLEALYRRIDTEGESPQTLLQVGRLLTAQGRVPEAVTSLSRAVALAPEWAEAHYELGKAYYLNLENDRAVVEFNRALEKDPALARAHTGLGLVAMVRGRPAEAAAQLRIAQAMDPDDPVHRVNLATLARWTGEYDRAAAILEEVLRERPSFQPAVQERQRLLQAMQKAGEEVRS